MRCLAFVFAASCTGEAKVDGDTGTSETGLDDTDNTGALDATGEWSGDCTQDETSGSAYGYHVILSLVDNDGALTGALGVDVFYGTGGSSSTTTPYMLYGTREGSHVQLSVDYSTGGTVPGSFDLTLDGDTLSGSLRMYGDLELSCLLVR